MGNKPDWVGKSYKKGEILKMADGGDVQEAGEVNLNPYGFRHAERVSDPVEVKGKGYFGVMPSSEGISTEISADNGEFSYPMMVPGMSEAELNILLKGGKPTDAMYDKAEAHARKRIAEGKSPFAGKTELRMPPPKD